MARLETQLLAALAQLAALETRVAALEAATPPVVPPAALPTSPFVATLLDAPDAATVRSRLKFGELPAGPVGTLLQSGGPNALPVWRSLVEIGAALPAMPWTVTPPSP